MSSIKSKLFFRYRQTNSGCCGTAFDDDKMLDFAIPARSNKGNSRTREALSDSSDNVSFHQNLVTWDYTPRRRSILVQPRRVQSVSTQCIKEIKEWTWERSSGQEIPTALRLGSHTQLEPDQMQETEGGDRRCARWTVDSMGRRHLWWEELIRGYLIRRQHQSDAWGRTTSVNVTSKRLWATPPNMGPSLPCAKASKVVAFCLKYAGWSFFQPDFEALIVLIGGWCFWGTMLKLSWEKKKRYHISFTQLELQLLVVLY
jgi:hypothetical protein